MRFSKYLNAAVAGFSFLQSSLTRKGIVYGMPVAAGIELTNLCNLNCPECSTGSDQMSREKGFMDEALFGKIIDDLSPYLLYVNLYFQGEPMLHPRFFSFVKRCSGIFSAVSTNGHFINEENAERLVKSGLGKLIISLDGMDQETYSAYRIKGDINLVINGIGHLIRARKKYPPGPRIEIQFLVNRLNEHQIPQVRKFCSDAGVSLKLKSMQIINTGLTKYWIPAEKKYSRYSLKGSVYSIKNTFPDRCPRLWFNPVITWDGKVIPCCFDKDAEHIMGDLKEDTFREIWDGPRYRIFRRSILTGRGAIEICRNCTSGMYRISV